MTPAPTPAPTPTPTSAPTGPRRTPAACGVFVEGVASGEAPRQYRAGGRHYVVTEVHGHWVTATPWWLTGQEVEVHTWRVTVAAQSPSRTCGRVVDLRCAGNHWQLTRVGGAR